MLSIYLVSKKITSFLRILGPTVWICTVPAVVFLLIMLKFVRMATTYCYFKPIPVISAVMTMAVLDDAEPADFAQ